MRKYIFRCKTCDTVMSIETELPDDKIHMVPPCPCGVSRMDWLGSDAYKYGIAPVDDMYGRESSLYNATGPTGYIPKHGVWDA